MKLTKKLLSSDLPINPGGYSAVESGICGQLYHPSLFIFQLKASGSKVHLISMVRHDTETVFQQIKELGMTGKGWVWIGTDGATSSTFNQNKDLQRTMEGMIGTQPKNGEGSIYLKFLANWIKKDSTTYPGIVHSKPVSKTYAYSSLQNTVHLGFI